MNRIMSTTQETMATLIAHPNATVRAALRQGLGRCPFLRVVGEAASPEETMELLDAIPYGALFLDAHMQTPAEDASSHDADEPRPRRGLELARALTVRRRRPMVVFMAEDQTLAYDAFELEALDFLLWPWDDARFAKTLEKLGRAPAPEDSAREHAGSDAEDGAQPPPAAQRAPLGLDEDQPVTLALEDAEEDELLSAIASARAAAGEVDDRALELEKLPVKLGERTLLIPYDQIVFVEAEENYSYVHTVQERYLTSWRLIQLEERLTPHRFFRAHRKFLVNLDMVTEIASLPGGNYMLRTAGRKRMELPIGRRRITQLKQAFGI